MARIARIVVPHTPHHVTQRGNRRQKTFFCNEDYVLYRSLLMEWCAKTSIELVSHCLMPNHVHLVVIPKQSESLRVAMSEIHRRYTRHVNFREHWRGHLWQGRFFSVPLEAKHLENAIRYVELNPVRAGLVSRPELYVWSSAYEENRSPGFYEECDDFDEIRKMTMTGRPTGSSDFLERIRNETGIDVRVKRPGPKARVSLQR